MDPKIELIKEYLKKVDLSKDKYTVAEFLHLVVNERFGYSIPPKHEMLKVCKDIGMAIYYEDTEIEYIVMDKEGNQKNIYPEYVLAKFYFKHYLEVL